MRNVLICAFFGLLASAAPSQQSKDAVKWLRGINNPVTTIFRGEMRVTGEKFAEAAEEMPAERYKFRAAEKLESFAELVVATIEQNYEDCAATTGSEAPKHVELTKESSKEQLVSELKRSFSFCDSSFSHITDKQLRDVVPLTREMLAERAGGLFMLLHGWDRRSAVLSVYLRMNQQVPPGSPE